MNRRRTLLAGTAEVLTCALARQAARKSSFAARHAAMPDAIFATTTRTTEAAQAEALARAKR